MLSQFKALTAAVMVSCVLLGPGLSVSHAAPSKGKPATAVVKSNAERKISRATVSARPIAKAKANRKVVRTKESVRQAVKDAKVLRVTRAAPVRSGIRKASLMHPTGVASDLNLESGAVYVQDLHTGTTLLEKNASAARPIASISKLMTAMVVLDAHQSMDELLVVDEADVDRVKFSSSRLAVGTQLPRKEMMRLALMSSENRAAHALARHYPGGVTRFVSAMNRKARELGLRTAQFFDPTGLDPRNVASPEDLAGLVAASARYPAIRTFSTDDEKTLPVANKTQVFRNTNPFIRNGLLDVVVQKTGYISEAGRCVVMQALINNRPTLIVLLDAQRKEARVQDTLAIKRWLEKKAQV